ncbi:TIGR03621 family F420-dependent LLM class oxidoreductase [Amycolatopsis sp. NPDC059090]|uniref:TIGR03621 family F420-dependent LLM class oxidoreductase n=1 Tax=unclassified Amycolatopsis TaxID=2618356 RepID=UPI003670501B
MHPIRFAAQVRNAKSGSEWRNIARRAERLGYSSILIPDHLNDHFPPLVGMTLAAEATTSLKVGTLVCNNDFREPTMLAKEIAALNSASGDRIEFGLGAGWQQEEYDRLGIKFDRPGVRIERLTESVQLMKELWTTGQVRMNGKHYTVEASVGIPATNEFRCPSLTIGGGGRKVLSLAAEKADIVGFNASMRSGTRDNETARSITAESFEQRVAWVRDAAGDRLAKLEFQCLLAVCQIVPDRQEMIETLTRHTPLNAEEIATSPALLFGSAEEICAQLEQWRDQFGFTYWVVPAASMESFAPVVEHMTGR